MIISSPLKKSSYLKVLFPGQNCSAKVPIFDEKQLIWYLSQYREQVTEIHYWVETEYKDPESALYEYVAKSNNSCYQASGFNLWFKDWFQLKSGKVLINYYWRAFCLP